MFRCSAYDTTAKVSSFGNLISTEVPQKPFTACNSVPTLTLQNPKSLHIRPLRRPFFLLLPLNWYRCCFALYSSFFVRSLTTQAWQSCPSSLSLKKTFTVCSHLFSQIKINFSLLFPIVIASSKSG